ncbi:hypothetical protein IF650_05085 [Cellulosimicrobium terreum]|nr:hypothetical protein [Cellulosimicrobium terreum]
MTTYDSHAAPRHPDGGVPADHRPAAARSTTQPPSFPPAQGREPGAARSAVPVVVSVGLLFGLAVAAAFVGRGLIEMLSALVAP